MAKNNVRNNVSIGISNEILDALPESSYRPGAVIYSQRMMIWEKGQKEANYLSARTFNRHVRTHLSI